MMNCGSLGYKCQCSNNLIIPVAYLARRSLTLLDRYSGAEYLGNENNIPQHLNGELQVNNIYN
jgi:hypothetical protein